MKYIVTFFIGVIFAINGMVHADTSIRPPQKIHWSFKGLTGTFDRAALQRGFQVYKEVCASCHSLEHIRYGSLAGQGKSLKEIRSSNLGLTMEEVAVIAREYSVADIDDEGQPTTRPALPSDRFVSPFPNERAARAANNGSVPPDLSLVVKSRKGGADYLYSLLVGYAEAAPEGMEVGEGRYYNPYFEGQQIAMQPPFIVEGQVAYADGTVATIEQMAKDVTAFLAWAAEPEMEERHAMGVKVLFYLFTLTIVFYLAYRKVWRDVS